jgi:hypothetical protein
MRSSPQNHQISTSSPQAVTSTAATAAAAAAEHLSSVSCLLLQKTNNNTEQKNTNFPHTYNNNNKNKEQNTNTCSKTNRHRAQQKKRTRPRRETDGRSTTDPDQNGHTLSNAVQQMSVLNVKGIQKRKRDFSPRQRDTERLGGNQNPNQKKQKTKKKKIVGRKPGSPLAHAHTLEQKRLQRRKWRRVV